MIKEKQLLAELAAADRAQKEAREVWAKKRAAVSEAKADFNAKAADVDEARGQIDPDNLRRAVLENIAAALRLKSKARELWSDRRAKALEARATYTEKSKLVDEIQQEIETGDSGRPLLDQINAKEQAAQPPAPAPARRGRKPKGSPEPKLDGLEFPGVQETFKELIDETAEPAEEAKPFWTTPDLNTELGHAIYNGQHIEHGWAHLAIVGVTDQLILDNLAVHWPPKHEFVPPEISGGKHGYTIAVIRGQPLFWIGRYHGPHHNPSLQGTVLALRVNRILKLPVPSEASGYQPQEMNADGTGFTTLAIPNPPVAPVQPPRRGRGRPPKVKESPNATPR